MYLQRQKYVIVTNNPLHRRQANGPQYGDVLDGESRVHVILCHNLEEPGLVKGLSLQTSEGQRHAYVLFLLVFG